MMQSIDELIQKRSEEEVLLLLRCHNEELQEQVRERKQDLESLRNEKKLITKKIEEDLEESLSPDTFLQTKPVEIVVEKERKQWEIVEVKRAMVRKQEEEISQMKEKRDQKLKTVDEMVVSYNFLEKTIKMTMFDNVQEFVSYLENLFYTREKLYEAETIKMQDIDTKRNEVLSLENRIHVASVDNNFQSSQLLKELEKYRSEEHIWEAKWKKIQGTAAAKILMLGQVKMAIVNMYEMTGGNIEKDGINITDTERQLDKIVTFIQDREDIVKQFELPTERAGEYQVPI